MTKYLYDKYRTIASGYVPRYTGATDFMEDSSWQFAVNPTWDITLYSAYEWDYSLQRFVGKGTRRDIPQGGGNVPGMFYIADYNANDLGYRVTEIGSEIYTESFSGSRYYKTKRVAEREPGAARGAFIETIATESTAYPNNGVHTDGFWYVRRGIASKKTVVNVQTHDSLIVSDGDQYTLQGTVLNQWYESNVTLKFRINGGNTFNISTVLANAQSKNFTKTLTINGDKIYDGTTVVAQNIPRLDWNTVEIWADGGEYSSESSTISFSVGYPYLAGDASLLSAVSYLEELVPEILTRRLSWAEVNLTAAEALNKKEYVVNGLTFEPKFALYYNTTNRNTAYGFFVGFATKDAPLVVSNISCYNYVSQSGATTNKNNYETSVSVIFQTDGVTLKAAGASPSYYNNDLRILIFG